MRFDLYCEDLRNKMDWINYNNINSWEDAWNKCVRPDWMLELIKNDIIVVDEDMLRKFACRCLFETPIGDDRTTYNLLKDERLINAVETVYHYTNGGETSDDLKKASRVARDAYNDILQKSGDERNIVMAAMSAIMADEIDAAKFAAIYTMREASLEYEEIYIRAFHANLLRETVGKSFFGGR
jgi:hypothetical protein